MLDSAINTVTAVPLTSNTAHERFPGNVLIPSAASGLEKDSVALVSQLGPVSWEFLDTHPAGTIPAYLLNQITAGVRLVTGV